MSTDVTAERVLAEVPTRLLIGKTWSEAAGGRSFPVNNPADGTLLAEVADATPADGLAALDAAAAAADAWAATPPRERGEILRRAYEEIQAGRDELAVLITLEMGKPLADAYAEIDYGADFFRWFAEEAVRIDGGYKVSPNGRGRILVTRQPVGPCLLVTPWNFPLAMGTRKIGPALAAGCTVVIKPAEETPLTTLALAAILERCGVPPGVVNVVTTSDPAALVGPLLADPRLRKLSFTGSTEVGRLLLAQAAGTVLRTSMELGGNAPFLVFDDADLDAAVEGAIVAKLRNMGEACTAANRFYVQRPVAEEFANRLAARMADLRVAPGLSEGSQIGPLINEAGREKVAALVEEATREGARVLTGGSPLDGPGYFYAPTVLTDIPGTADLLTQEIFGPVAPVLAFDTEQEAVALANATEYGLVAYVYTRDLNRALRTSEALETGMVGLNQGVVSNAGAPFGGVKQSGLGREGGPTGIDEYLATKYIAIDL
jgi:succinate-semialdehyde dehydrogenase/glutarate-semialdehyde dehydrogenase